MRHEKTVIAHHQRQLTALAQMRNQPHVAPFDTIAINELFNRDPDTLTDKDHELVQTLASRYLCEVMT